MSSKIAKLFLLAFTCLALATAAYAAAEHGSKDEAKALVTKTIAAIKASGSEKTYAEITGKDAKFIDRDLYPVVYDMNGNCLAHGANPKLVGKDLLDVEDADGRYFVKERVEKAKTNASFWQEYKYANPVSKKIEPKEAYCEKLEATIVCSGAYKP